MERKLPENWSDAPDLSKGMGHCVYRYDEYPALVVDVELGTDGTNMTKARIATGDEEKNLRTESFDSAEKALYEARRMMEMLTEIDDWYMGLTGVSGSVEESHA